MNRTRARELAQSFLAEGDAVGWFDALYSEAGDDASRVPWADLVPNPNLVEWLEANGVQGNGRRALVIGCGLGDDAEVLAGLGFEVTAFDVSSTAINWCRNRFPNSAVSYQAADLLALPVEWHGAFDLVVEVYTLQVLPTDIRPVAMRAMADCVTADGSLLVIARGREPQDDPGQMPWPLTRQELAVLTESGLTEFLFEDFLDGESPPVRRFRVEYRKSI